MGLSYSNINIKKTAKITSESVREYLISEMKSKGFEYDEKTDDVTVSIYYPANSDWISVTSDSMNFKGYDDTNAVSSSASSFFHTDVIAASCIDSDWGFINLVNTEKSEEGWINVCKPYTGKNLHRKSISAFRSLVSDYPALLKIVANEPTYAESTFCELATLLNMKEEQTFFSADTALEYKENIIRLSFKAPDSVENIPSSFKICYSRCEPCKMGEPKDIYVQNVGGVSKGIGILFWGDYIQNNDIEITDCRFVSNVFDNEKRTERKIELSRVKLNDGTIGLYWEDRDFAIPHAVGNGMSDMKQSELILKKAFGVIFTPTGNARKSLDITLRIYPLTNAREVNGRWRVWDGYKSKIDFIHSYNKMWNVFSGVKGIESMQINPDDYDLD